jgi:hypothetical protein
MHAGIVGIKIAAFGLDPTVDFVGSNHGGDQGAISIAPLTRQNLKPYPITAVRDSIHEQVRRPVTIYDEQVKTAIVIYVADGGTATAVY